MRTLIFLALAIALSACGGGGSSSTGTGSQNSPFVGSYAGTTTITADVPGVPSASQSLTVPISIFVQANGTVLVGDPDTIFGNGPLNGDSITFQGNAAPVLDDSTCSGTITLSGTFSTGDNGVVTFNGSWSSNNVVCDGITLVIGGSLTATRTSTSVNTSRILESVSHPVARAVGRVPR